MQRVLLILFTFMLFFGGAQAQAKRYIFLEHFTNSLCGVCASQNPGFFSRLQAYKNEYHHMTVHPPIPYSQCLLYQANTADNSARSNFYGIQGTPTVVIHGLSSKSANGVTNSVLDAELNKTSPLEIKVVETGTQNRSVSVEVKTIGTRPAGTYKLVVVALEKELNYASPNGEKIHYNVFRDFVSSVNGDDINLAATGSSVTKNFTISIQPSWVENQIYMLAWIQDVSSKEVLNSGTKFDGLTATHEITVDQFSIYPNPVKEQLNIQFKQSLSTDSKLIISNLFGKEIYASQLKNGQNQVHLSVSDWNRGIYFVKIQTGKKLVTKKWLKD
ncbi:MAG: T9SS type A sorting domain-containing protein [Saprospiraceae bacterium]